MPPNSLTLVYPKLRQDFGCLLAAIATAAVDQNHLILVQQFGSGPLSDVGMGDHHNTGDVRAVVFLLCACVQDEVSFGGVHAKGVIPMPVRNRLKIRLRQALRCHSACSDVTFAAELPASNSKDRHVA